VHCFSFPPFIHPSFHPSLSDVLFLLPTDVCRPLSLPFPLPLPPSSSFPIPSLPPSFFPPPPLFCLTRPVVHWWQVHVHELNYEECLKSFVFRGSKEVDTSKVAQLLGLTATGRFACPLSPFSALSLLCSLSLSVCFSFPSPYLCGSSLSLSVLLTLAIFLSSSFSLCLLSSTSASMRCPFVSCPYVTMGLCVFILADERCLCSYVYVNAVCTSACMYVCTCMYVCVYVYVYVYAVCMFVCTCMCVYVRPVCVRVCTFMCICMYVYMYVCMCVCMYAYVYAFALFT